MICLSFDTDHCDEARMEQFVRSVEIPGAATFFCTQPYDCLREDSDHEVCPHPNLGAAHDWDATLTRMRAAFPTAEGWRSHGCVFSHMLAQRAAMDRYVYVSTHSEIGRAGVQPSRDPWGIWQMPIFYMDNLDFSLPRFWPGIDHRPFEPRLIDVALRDDGIYVFDFHPVHLLLNSDSAEAYLASRDAFLAGAPVDELRRPGVGARAFYELLIARMAQTGVRSVRMRDALRAAVGA
jgi:hypothetical protein